MVAEVAAEERQGGVLSGIAPEVRQRVVPEIVAESMASLKETVKLADIGTTDGDRSVTVGAASDTPAKETINSSTPSHMQQILDTVGHSRDKNHPLSIATREPAPPPARGQRLTPLAHWLDNKTFTW